MRSVWTASFGKTALLLLVSLFCVADVAAAGERCLAFSVYEPNTIEVRGQFDLQRDTYVPASSPEKISYTFPEVFDYFPSPDKRYLAHVDLETATLVVIPNVERVQSQEQLERQTPLYRVKIASGKVHDMLSFAELIWSPDSRYVPVPIEEILPFHYPSAFIPFRLDLYGLDGTVIVRAVDLGYGFLRPYAHTTVSYPPAVWSADSQMIFYLQEVSFEPLKLYLWAFHLAERRRELLATDLVSFPVFRHDSRYALLTTQTGSSVQVSILNISNAEKTSLGDHPFDYGFDFWWVGDRAFVNWDGLFVWANADGSSRHELDTGPGGSWWAGNIVLYPRTSYRISPNQRWWLIQIVLPDDEFAYWLVDLNRDKATRLRIDPRHGPLEVSFAPDSRTLALINEYYPPDNLGLYVVRLDGSFAARHLAEPGVFDVRWSSDGSQFVAIPCIPMECGDTAPALFARDGRVLRRYKNFPWFRPEEYMDSNQYWHHVFVDWDICRS